MCPLRHHKGSGWQNVLFQHRRSAKICPYFLLILCLSLVQKENEETINKEAIKHFMLNEKERNTKLLGFFGEVNYAD